MYKQNQTVKPSSRRRYIVFIIPALLIIGIFASLELTNTTHVFHKQPAARPVSTAGQATKGEPTSDTATGTAASGDTPTPATEPGDSKGTAAESSSLIEPSGTFVSAHSGVPLTAALSSVCNTSTGASCSIQFIMGSVTKSLPAMTTDRGGAAYWNSWTPQSIGLTTGSWKVTAVATLNGQSKTANDPMDLEVQ